MNIFKDSFFLTLSKGIRVIIALVVTMLASRIMSIELFGTYKQMLLIYGIVTAVMPLGIPISVSFFYQNIDNYKKHQLVTNTIILSAVQGIVAVIPMFVFKEKLSDLFSNSILENYFPILCLYILITIFSSFIENLYISSNHVKLLSSVSIVYYVIYSICVFSQITLINDIYTLFLLMSILEIIRTTAFLILFFNYSNYRITIDFSFMKRQLIYCLPLGITALFQTLNSYLDKLIVSSLYTPTEYAIYINGTTEIPFVGLITLSIASVSLPVMSKLYNTDANTKGLVNLWKGLTIKTAGFIYPVFWVLIFYCNGYIKFIFSDNYADSVSIFFIYILKLPLYCTVFSNILIVLSKQKYIVYNVIICILLNIVLSYFLIKYFGLIGGAISAVIIQAILVSLQVYQIRKCLKYSLRELIPFKEICMLLGLSGIIAFSVFIVSVFINFGDVLNLFLYGIIIYILCIIAFCNTGLLPKQKLYKIFSESINKCSKVFLRW